MSVADDVFTLEDYSDDPAFAAAFEDAESRQRLLRGLVAQRRALKLRQVDVAERMQTKQSFVSQLERGETDPQLSTLQRYARAVSARLVLRIDLPADCPWQPTPTWSDAMANTRYENRRTVTAVVDSASAARLRRMGNWERTTEASRLEFVQAS